MFRITFPMKNSVSAYVYLPEEWLVGFKDYHVWDISFVRVLTVFADPYNFLAVWCSSILTVRFDCKLLQNRKLLTAVQSCSSFRGTAKFTVKYSLTRVIYLRCSIMLTDKKSDWPSLFRYWGIIIHIYFCFLVRNAGEYSVICRKLSKIPLNFLMCFHRLIDIYIYTYIKKTTLKK